MPEPAMPNFNDFLPDPPEVKAAVVEPAPIADVIVPVVETIPPVVEVKEDVENPENGVMPEKPAVKDEVVVEKPAEPLQEVNEIIDSWRVDRDKRLAAEHELSEARRKLAEYEQDDDEFEDLSDDERVNKLLERKEAEKAKVAQEQVETARAEVEFERKANPYFKENEKRIIAVAVKHDCHSLTQAISIDRAEQAVIAKANADIEAAKALAIAEEKRKKGADSGAGGGGGGNGIKTAGKGYDPTTDANKSFGDIYREGMAS